MKTFTVREFLDALKKNGYPWHKGLFDFNGASCAIGQAMRNLYGEDIYRGKLRSYYWEQSWKLDTALFTLAGVSIVTKNDSGDTASYQEVINYAEEGLQEYLDRTIDLSKIRAEEMLGYTP